MSKEPLGKIFAIAIR